MIKKLLLISAMLAGSALLTANAAPVLSFNPTSQAVTLGDAVSVDIVLSGLEEGGLDQILSAFDVSVSYDSSILNATLLSIFVTPPFGIDPLINASSSSGEVQWDLTSFATDAALQAVQGNAVTLGTLTFATLSAGTSALKFSAIDLTGLGALALDPSVLDGSITVNKPNGNGSVPEPSAIMLMALAALGMTAEKRRKATA